MGIVFGHEPSGFDSFSEGVLGAEVLGEDDHDLVADVLVDRALATAKRLGGDPGEEVVTKAKVSTGVRSSVLAEKLVMSEKRIVASSSQPFTGK